MLVAALPNPSSINRFLLAQTRPAGKYDEVEMFGFTVVWQSYTPGGDVLKLAFDTQVGA